MSTKKQRIFKILFYLFISVYAFIYLCGLTVIGCNGAVILLSLGKVNRQEIPKCDAIIVHGAKVIGDTPSKLLRDRLDKGIELYFSGVADRIIMSGDHGREDYDEVNAMKSYAVEQGVPEEHIFTDHAGFDTYSSMYRAKEVFMCETVAVVTQQFHINRAVFLGESVGLEAYGVTCSEEGYRVSFFTVYVREPIARIKAVYSAIFKPSPKYLGDSIPIYGEASASWD